MRYSISKQTKDKEQESTFLPQIIAINKLIMLPVSLLSDN